MLDPATQAISASSERQAMDWSLVLASQDIPAFIERHDANHWFLLVDAEHYGRALDSIRRFRAENRGWGRHFAANSDLFHPGGVLFCAVAAILFRLSTEEFPALHSAWIFSSEKFLSGEWWRLFTAMLLHADISHLVSNMVIGAIMLGLAMAKFGTGWTLLASCLSGAAGFGAGLLFHPQPYNALGASGMIMGALGLVSTHTLSQLRYRGTFNRHALRGAMAGALLFVLLGFAPKTDVVAHSGGFFSGLIFGALLLLFPAAQKKWGQRAAWAVFLAIMIGASFEAVAPR